MLLRNWQTFANSSIAITAQKDVLYWLKSVLTNTNSAGNTLPSARVWTVVSSSNASTTSNSDLWTSTSALTRAAAGTAHSWIVLQNTTLGVYMIIDYVGTLNYAADVIVSTDAPTGGTTLNRPTATNTFSFTGWNFDRPTLTAETRYVSMTADETGGFWLHHHRANGEQIVVASLGVLEGVQNRNTGAGGNTRPTPIGPPQYNPYPTINTIVGFQHGGNQTGNAHIMTPSGSNTPAKVFAGNGGMVRSFDTTGATASAWAIQAMMPPRSTISAATESVWFSTIAGGIGSAAQGGLFAWPIIAVRYFATAGVFNDTFLVPDLYVTPGSTGATVATAGNGGPYMHLQNMGALFNATTNPYVGVYMNGLIAPWGAGSTPMQGSTNDDFNAGFTTVPLPDVSGNSGMRRGNMISAARGTRGIGGW
jgi:hypothetical protein